VGIQDELIAVNLNYKTKTDLGSNWNQIWDHTGNTNLTQVYAESKYNISEKLTLNTGLHAQHLFLNNSSSIEPRVGLKYDLSNNSSLSFGYGLHSQMQPINVYFLQTQNADGTYSYTNKNLGFTKSNQFVVGYDLKPFTDWRLKAEVYYQKLYNVPITSYSSSYSMLNTGAGFKPDITSNLVNSGTGKNYGVELTIEKFFSKGYYALFTSSLYESKYTASDGIERNTAFNGKYVYNILAGKEWKVGKDKRNKIALDFKFTNAGGRYYTPVDLGASQTLGHEQLSNDAYSSRYSNYFRMDIKLGYTFNSGIRKLSQSFSLDLQNVTNHQNVFSQGYDSKLQTISTTYQLGLFPNFTYKLQF
jgi:hypothetical protein